VSARGKSFIVYDDNENPAAAKVDADLLHKYQDVLAALHAASDKLTFKRTTVKAACLSLAKDEVIGPKLKMEEKFHESWAETITRRIQNACRVVSQATLANKKPPKWTSRLAFLGGVPDAAADSPKPVAEEPSFGFCSEVLLAWRMVGKKMEWCSSLKEPPNPKPTDSMIAVFDDGSEKAVSQMSVATYRDLRDQGGSRSSRDKNLVWLGEHSVSHNKISVMFKRDHHFLCIIRDQSSMRCMVRVDTFGKDVDAEDVRQRAADLMMSIAKDYADDKIAVDKLYEERDKRLRNMSIEVTSRKSSPVAALKRPAAAAAQTRPMKAARTKKEKVKAEMEPKIEKQESTFEEEPKEEEEKDHEEEGEEELHEDEEECDDEDEEDEDDEEDEEEQHDEAEQPESKTKSTARKRPAAATEAVLNLSKFLVGPPVFKDPVADR